MILGYGDISMGYYDSYLEHHGILGQKWGVRRFQNKDGTLTAEGRKRYGTVGPNEKVTHKTMRQYRKDITGKYEADDPRTKKMEELENQAYALASKYDFDGDDGGGGTTEADRQAGRKYMDLWDKHSEIEAQRDYDIGKKVEADLIEKYGEKRVKSLDVADNAAMAGAVLAAVALTPVIVLTAPVTIPLAIATAAIASSVSNKKAEKAAKKAEAEAKKQQGNTDSKKKKSVANTVSLGQQQIAQMQHQQFMDQMVQQSIRDHQQMIEDQQRIINEQNMLMQQVYIPVATGMW